MARHALTFSHGRELYEDIRKDQVTVAWRKSDFIDFIDYYMSVDLDFVLDAVRQWQGLTPSELFFLILEHEGKSEAEIIHIMGISETALRVRRSRLRKKALTVVIALVTLSPALVACQDHSETSTALNHLSMLSMHNEDDSVMAGLQRLDTTAMGEGDKAMYHLLNAKTRFRLSVSPNPTAPLNTSIAYFKAHDDSLLADTYYYIGAIMSDTCKISDYKYAMPYLKKAEAIGERHHYYMILDKVYERIANINLVSDNGVTAQGYARKLMKIAGESGSGYLRALGYYALMSTWYHTGRNDSAQYYAEKTFNDIHLIPLIERPHIVTDIYAIAGNDLRRKLQQQMENLDKIHPSPILEANLAIYYHESGSRQRADSLWKKALSTRDLRTKSDILKCMILQLQDDGRNEEVAALTQQLDSVNEQLNEHLQDNNIQQIQDDLDSDSIYGHLKNKLVYILLIDVIICILVVILLLWRQRRSQRKITQLYDEGVRYQTILNDLQTAVISDEDEIDKRQKELAELKDRHEQLFNRGRVLYKRWKNGECVKEWKKEDYVCLLDYYMSLDLDFIKSLSKDYHDLTPSEMFFLILEHEGETPDEITMTLDISPSAYRLRKSRIREKHL